MIPSKDLPQLYGKITVLGRESQKIVSFIRGLGLNYILSDDTAPVVISTEKGVVPKDKRCYIAYPYYKGLKKSEIICKEILTYAVENNGADVVAKNIRIRDDLVTFELLTQGGIGRVFVRESDKDAPKYALALACGLMLTGMPLADIIALVSQA